MGRPLRGLRSRGQTLLPRIFGEIYLATLDAEGVCAESDADGRLTDQARRRASALIGLFFGADLRKSLYVVEAERAGLTLAGYAADPSCDRGGPQLQYLFVNGRWVRDRGLSQALQEAERTVAALGLPLRSVEIELGPSQVEFTFRPQSGLAAADAMILFRSAVKQIARRNGYLASFMCRPALPNLMSCGWHLHQSLIEKATKRNAFAFDHPDGLSTVGRHYLGGLLAHARAALPASDEQ